MAPDSDENPDAVHGTSPTPAPDPRLPIFLKPSDYLERFRAAQSALGKSLLVPMALIAFWFAIESSYDRFLLNFLDSERLRELSENKQGIQNERETERVRLLRKGRLVLATDEGAAGGNIHLRAERDEERQKNLAKIEKEVEALRVRLDAYRREAVDLSIAGTKLPSPPVYSPMLWLVAFLCWLAYFNSRRASAYRNVAAYFGALGEGDRAFGAAGEGSMFLAPLPPDIVLGVPPNVLRVSRAELLSMIGWTRRTERKYRLAILTMALFCAVVIFRIAYIAFDMTSDFAVQNGYIDDDWRMPNLISTGILVAMCLMSLLTLLLRASPQGIASEPELVSRRGFVLGAVGTILAGVAWWYREPLAKLADSLDRKDPMSASASAITGVRNPRYISPDKKAKRAKNHAVVADVSQRDRLVYAIQGGGAPFRRETVRLVYADASGKVRLLSRLRPDRQFSPVTDGDLARWASGRSFMVDTRSDPLHPSDVKPLSALSSVEFEVAALARIEAAGRAAGSVDAGRLIDEACDLLMAGALLTLQSSPRPNYRLADLLAGIAVRYGKEDTYLKRLKDVFVKSSTAVPLGLASRAVADYLHGLQAARLKRWDHPIWRKRWLDRSKNVLWHHPLEMIERPSKERAVGGKADFADRVVPANGVAGTATATGSNSEAAIRTRVTKPEKRQRPVWIA